MERRNPDFAPVDDSLFHRVLSALNVAVLERSDSGDAFHLRGLPPEWWRQCVGPTESHVLNLLQWSPFLQDYVADPHPAWDDKPGTIEKSGPWTESDRQGGIMTLEATALAIGSRRLLLIERLGAGFEQMHAIVQRAREKMLAEAVTVKSHRKAETRLMGQLEASERIKDDALALLQHLGLAALVLDERGCITFASDRGLEILGCAAEHLIGRAWDQALPLQPQDRSMIREMIDASSADRKVGPLYLGGPRPAWVEMEVHRDPRQPGRQIVVLNDRTELHTLRQALSEQASFHDLVGKSRAMLRTYQLVRDVAQVDTTVLIEGETGTGKELIARAIHFSSARAQKPFIAANCAGLTDSILTSQLFGHKRGAFTGAVADQQGLFEAAEGGTLFLDEIGDIPSPVQTALLRVLQEKEITRLGEARPRKVDVRVVAATHHNLSEDVIRGSFRADLLYRIRIARIQLPPLRERREDIPLLAHSFLSRLCAATGKTVDDLSPDTLRLLMSHAWPGNVRELKSALEFAVISCKGRDILPTDLPPEIAAAPVAPRPSTWIPLSGQDEKSKLLAALSEAKGNRTEAAKRLGVSRATFYRRLVELNIQPS
ncbi:sigma-54 interaction domain-containing protein [Candidatus Nitrospira nitrificans]|uniref:Sigma-54 dependent response regulator n=1 Tax=Candidatus Nitrospira nitrificans TaxID=1742973 RepID=A0A0S4LCA6_9BACT|nr:sigma 54-interacting transcriptional regulator [Candidatus Nitrospira nitrificans]CUS35267.1 Sigma-54 dependent response regulator [Candidatus Nitrospira nitrificans]